MIVEKYGFQRGNWCSKEAQGPYSIFGGILETAGFFSNLVSFKVGDGCGVCFGHDDAWCVYVA
jgi:hypothetical protein